MEKKVLIIGAGTMGSGVAIAFALHGYYVTLVDQTEERALKAKDRIHEIVADLVNTDYVPKDSLQSVEDHLIYEGEDRLAQLVPGFSLIIECVFEDFDVKKELYTRLDAWLSKDCLVCSNTSALNIFEAAPVSHPENLMITHWFNPAYIMELVEIVKGPETSDEAVTAVKTILQDIGKTASVINQYIPGFIVNRLGAALMREACHMIREGWTTAADIDSAIALTNGVRYAFEGPVALYDVVGWNIIQAGAKVMYPTLCNDTDNGNELAQEMIEKGSLGVAAGKGVYDYSGIAVGDFLNSRTEKIIKMQSFVKNGF